MSSFLPSTHPPSPTASDIPIAFPLGGILWVWCTAGGADSRGRATTRALFLLRRSASRTSYFGGGKSPRSHRSLGRCGAPSAPSSPSVIRPPARCIKTGTSLCMVLPCVGISILRRVAGAHPPSQCHRNWGIRVSECGSRRSTF